ncbi:MAG: cysteine hydrolase [Sedimentisphaerales bacterium]|nr:cysteine hydrolase [Sedimentisphaerales bacterium]
MIRPIRLRRKRVLIDIDTQKDLFLASGVACVRNHRRVLMNIRRVLAWARTKHVRMVSTELYKPGKNGDKYCIAGTKGQEKISYTLRKRRVEFQADGCTDLQRDIFIHYDQVILNKRCEDPFDEPRAERLLTEIKADEFIIIGGLAEGAVSATVLGLLQRGKHVTILVDAIGTHDRHKADMAFRKMKAKGAILTESRTYAGSTHLKTAGICDCKLCRMKEKPSQFQTSIGA